MSRKNTSKYHLEISVYGCKKSTLLCEGKEICISHRPTQEQNPSSDVLERIHRKSLLDHDVRVQIRKTNFPGISEYSWSKIIGNVGSYRKYRTINIDIPEHISASVMFGVHRYDLLTPSLIGSNQTTTSYFIGRERTTNKTEHRRMFNRVSKGKKRSDLENENMMERVKIVQDTAHLPVPDFVPVSSKTRARKGDLIWYRKASRSLTGRLRPQPYVSYDAFLHNKLNRRWTKSRVK